jgi:hypothetical protein
MNLAQLVEFLKEAELPVTANYFNGCANDSVTVDGLIEAEFVKRHIGEGMLLRSIQANVTTYVGCDMDMKFKVTDRNDVGIAVSVYDSNGKYVKSMNIPYKEWASKYGIPFHEAYLKKFDLK